MDDPTISPVFHGGRQPFDVLMVLESLLRVSVRDLNGPLFLR